MRIVRAPRFHDERVVKSITYTAGGTGAAATTTTIFNVTGNVLVTYTAAFCTTSLTESAGTPSLSYGTTGTVDLLIAATTATAIDINELWDDGTPSAKASLALPAKMKDIYIGNGSNISCTVGGTNNISAGAIRFEVYWRKMSDNGLVVPA